MNKRIRTLWIPCLVSSAGAMVCRLTLQQTVAPEQKLLNHAGLPLFQQLIWLATLPLLGAASAYLSRRNGGERSSIVIAALFPSIVMVPFWMVLATKMYHPSPSQWVGLLAVVLNWIIVPGMALLIGALPFLNPQMIFQWKLNSRTKSFWFPALISLTATMACPKTTPLGQPCLTRILVEAYQTPYDPGTSTRLETPHAVVRLLQEIRRIEKSTSVADRKQRLHRIPHSRKLI